MWATRRTLGGGPVERFHKVSLHESNGCVCAERPVASRDAHDNPPVICAPVSGRVVALDQVKDPAFACGMLGEGLGFEAEQNVVLSPVTGTVVADVKTKHALLIEAETGAEVLVHVGVDTVSLHGRGFTTFVGKGDRVRVGQPVIKFDQKLISERGLDNTVIVTVTNAEAFAEVRPVVKADVVEAGSPVLRAAR